MSPFRLLAESGIRRQRPFDDIAATEGEQVWGLSIDPVTDNIWVINYDDDTFLQITAVPVPEPSSLAMFGIGALGLFGYGRRRRLTSAAA